MEGTLEKNPLAARCDSSGSDDIPTGRDTPSPYSLLEDDMKTHQHPDEYQNNMESCANHDYANPLELKTDIKFELNKIDGARKKRNLIYESTNPSAVPAPTKLKQLPTKASDTIDGNRNNLSPRPRGRRGSGSDEELIIASTSSSDCGSKRRNRTLQCLVVVVFVLSLTAVSMAIVVFMNRTNTGADPIEQQVKTTPSDGDLTTLHTDKVNAEEVHQLRNNVTHLLDHVIPKLQEKIAELTNKLKNTQLQGPSGPQGPPGPSGVGDLSKCEYGAQTSKNPQSYPETYTSYVTEDDKFQIMSVTCSQIGAEVAVLETSLNNQGRRQYYCRCGGIALAAAFQPEGKNKLITCRIHYWRCPKKT